MTKSTERSCGGALAQVRLIRRLEMTDDYDATDTAVSCISLTLMTSITITFYAGFVDINQ